MPVKCRRPRSLVRSQTRRAARWQKGFRRIALTVIVLMTFCAGAHAQETPPQLPKQDEECLACHGQPGMKSEKGKNISISPEKHAGGAHAILGCKDCHSSIKEFPHPARVTKPQCATCHAEESAAAPKSVHATLGADSCNSCHGDVHEISTAAIAESALCARCHEEGAKQFAGSIHGQAAKAGDHDAPTCSSCHGAVHSILSSTDMGSATAKRNQPAMCARCHADQGFLSRHHIPIAQPFEQYVQSVHGRRVLAGKDGATCADCHGSHDVLPSRNEHSRVSHWNLAETCGACHKSVADVFKESVHGQAIKAGVRDAPDCTACHGEHLILAPTDRASPVNAANVSTETCGRCHGDARLVRLYNLPADRVPSFVDSYHGLALREGSLTAANCASCHGVHNIFAASDPRSTVNQANLAKTCGGCHKGVSEGAALGRVHVRISEGEAHPVVRWIRWIYLVLIPLTLGFMALHNLLDFVAKAIRPRPAASRGARVVRMNLWFRIAHWGVMLSFPTLVFTGFALKYPDAIWAKPFLLWEGKFALRGDIHRAAATLLLLATVYHFIHLATSRRDRAFLAAILPRWRDASDLIAVLRFNLGFTKQQPTFSKFSYAEKMEYWAFLWGTAVMAISGFLLWFNNFALRHFPKWITDAATAVHWYEALLATFSILLWHFYLVIFDPLVYPMDFAWLTGRVPAEHYEHSRPEYFHALERAGMVRGGEEQISENPMDAPEGSSEHDLKEPAGKPE